MPKGQKIIDWTAENDARLILTILAVENIYPNCEAVAAAFGGGVNALAISNRLSRLRRKAADEGLVAKAGTAAASKGRAGAGAGKNGKGKGGTKGGMLVESIESQDPASDDQGADSPPPRKTSAGSKGQKVLTGRVTKARNPGKKDSGGKVKIPINVDAEVGKDDFDIVEAAHEENLFYDAEVVDGDVKKEEDD